MGKRAVKREIFPVGLGISCCEEAGLADQGLHSYGSRAVRGERFARVLLCGCSFARGGRFSLVRPPCCPVRARHAETPSRASYHFPVASLNQDLRVKRGATGKRTMPGSVRQSTSLARTGQQGWCGVFLRGNSLQTGSTWKASNTPASSRGEVFTHGFPPARE
jgi:hypothetical protein